MLVLIPSTEDMKSGKMFRTISLEMSVRKLVAEATHRLPGNSLNFSRLIMLIFGSHGFTDYIANISGCFIELAK